MKNIILLALLMNCANIHSHYYGTYSKNILQAIKNLNTLKIPPYVYQEAKKTNESFYNFFRISSDPKQEILRSELYNIYNYLKTPSQNRVPLYLYKTPINYPILGQTNGFASTHALFIRKTEKEKSIGSIRSTIARAAVYAHNKDAILRFTLNKVLSGKENSETIELKKLIHRAIKETCIPLSTITLAHKNIALLDANFYGYRATQCYECLSEELKDNYEKLKLTNKHQLETLKKAHKELKGKQLLCLHHSDQKIDFTIP